MEKLLSLTNITKKFPGVLALSNVHLNVYKGKIMGLVGENGAGKSTICKIITGVYKKDEGTIIYKKKEINFTNVKDSKKAGIAIVHQELQMCNDLTVLENLFLGVEIRNKFGLYNWTTMNAMAKTVLKSLNVKFTAKTFVKDLSVGEQQMVEIGRAVLQDADLIILDEPTASLTDLEVSALFEVVQKLKNAGKSFIYISHRLKELPIICDDISVFRDGSFIVEKPIKDFDEDSIVEAIVGRPIKDQYPRIESQNEKIIFEVKNFTNKFLKNLSISLREGVTTGLFGLMGSGRTELVKSIIGEIKINSGETILDNKKIRIKNPNDALKNGIYYCSEDRKSEGLLLDFSIKYNIGLSSPKKLKLNKYFPIYSTTKEEMVAKPYIKKLDIKTPNINQKVLNLSGGNQQKVILAKAMLTRPKILILDEPTRGIDVGAKKMIYELINKFKKSGISILMISSDLPEVLGISDYIYVMSDGNINGFLNNENKKLTAEQVMKLTLIKQGGVSDGQK